MSPQNQQFLHQLQQRAKHEPKEKLRAETLGAGGYIPEQLRKLFGLSLRLKALKFAEIQELKHAIEQIVL